MPLKIYYPGPSNDRVLSELRRSAEEIEILAEGDDPSGCSILIEGRPTDERLDAMPFLKSVIVPFAGIPEPTLKLVRERPHLSLHNLHHNATATAELAVALLLAAAKLVPSMDRKMRGHDWSPRYELSRTVLVEGKTALILGYGEIGRKVSAACCGLGMKVLGTRASLTRAAEDDRAIVHPSSEMHALLPLADALIVTLPHTPETTGLIGTAQIDMLPQDATLINVSRAAIVDEEALYLALREGKLHSAGLDVWYAYPSGGSEASRGNVPGYFTMPSDAKSTPPSRFPFHELDNVVMSPHRGGSTMETEQKRVEHLARLVGEAAAGREMPNRVDVQRGY